MTAKTKKPKKEKSAGGIIVRKGRLAITSQRGRSFSFPKGHIRKSEDALKTAYREIKEETGLLKKELKLIKKLGVIKRTSGSNGNPKDIHMFLFKTDKKELKPKDRHNPEAFWEKIEKASKHLFHKEDKEFLTEYMDEIIAFSE